MSKNLRVRVDIEDIAEAVSMGSVDNANYLDTETGETIWLPDENIVEMEEIRKKIESDSINRYLYIPFVSPREGYRDMENFIDSLSDENLKEKLYIAINGSGAFRRFKDVLLYYPDVREDWFKFCNRQNRERAILWLEESGIEVVEK